MDFSAEEANYLWVYDSRSSYQAIDSETLVWEKDWKRILKHLDAIGQLGNDPKNLDLLEKAGDALDALPTIIKRGNGLLEFAEKHLPTTLSGARAVLAPLEVSW